MTQASTDSPSLTHRLYYPRQVYGQTTYDEIGECSLMSDRKGVVVELKVYPEGLTTKTSLLLRKCGEPLSHIPKKERPNSNPPYIVWGAVERGKNVRYDRIGFGYTHGDNKGITVYLNYWPLNAFCYVCLAHLKPDSWTKK